MKQMLYLTCLIFLFSYIRNENWRNLKIKYDFKLLEKAILKDGMELKDINFLKNSVFLIIKDYIYITFFVKDEYELTYDNEKYDLFLSIEPISNSSNNGVFAAASPYAYHKESKRPIKGVIKINLYYLKNNLTSKTKFYSYLFALFHEAFHVMGYTKYGLHHLKEKARHSKDLNTFIIESPNVLKYAKKQYGCDNLEKLLFENRNNSSHWEDIQLGNDDMVATVKRNQKITEITLAFLEDSGWYKINYNMGEILPFGLKKGCDFINNPSTKFSEFSKNFKYGCSSDYMATSRFFKTSYSNNLLVNQNNATCSNVSKGKQSCFEFKKHGRLNHYCAKSQCFMENGKLIMEYVHENTSFICRNDNEKVERNGITVSCPIINKFCDYRFECKNSCSGRGVCFNGQCICKREYDGVACEFEKAGNEDVNYYDLNKKCHFNGYFDDNKCICYENYEGHDCKIMKVNAGSFGTKCKDSIYIKCYTGEYYNYINREYVTNHNYKYPIVKKEEKEIESSKKIEGKEKKKELSGKQIVEEEDKSAKNKDDKPTINKKDPKKIEKEEEDDKPTINKKDPKKNEKEEDDKPTVNKKEPRNIEEEEDDKPTVNKKEPRNIEKEEEDDKPTVNTKEPRNIGKKEDDKPTKEKEINSNQNNTKKNIQNNSNKNIKETSENKSDKTTKQKSGKISSSDNIKNLLIKTVNNANNKELKRIVLNLYNQFQKNHLAKKLIENILKLK